MTERRKGRDTSLVLGMAAGMLLTLVVTAGLDVAASRGIVLESALFQPAGVPEDPAPPEGMTGLLRVPETVCRVRIDGREMKAEGGLLSVTPGPHRVELFNEHDDIWVTRVEMTVGTRIDVIPEWTGELIVEPGDAPAGVVLRIDGVACATPPTVVENVLSGKHTLSLHHASELVWEETLTLRAGQVRRVVPDVVGEPAIMADAPAAAPLRAAPPSAFREEPQPR